MNRLMALSTLMFDEISGHPESVGNAAGESVVREGLVPNPKARLKEQFHEVCRFKHVSLRTEEAYWQWIRRYLVFCRDHPHLSPALSPPSEGAEREKRWRHPKEMGAPEVAQFLAHLAVAGDRGRQHPEPGAQRAGVFL